MWIKKRHRRVMNFIRPFFKHHFKSKYNCTFDDPISCKEGALIISNHTTTLDPFMIGILFKEPVYYMASYDLFQHRFLGRLIKYLVNPIPKEKSKSSDLAAIKDCLRVAKENGNICIFIEGNRTLSGKLGNVEKSIVKLVKALKKPLYICNIEGGYGTDPRWGNKLRKGKMHAGVKAYYQYEELKDMDNDELYELIVNSITVDDYNYHHSYKGKNKANYLERIFHICPVCKRTNHIYSKGDYVLCKACGLKLEFTDSLRFKANTSLFTFETISQWYDWQIAEMKKMHFEMYEEIYSDEVFVYMPRLFKSKKKIGKGVMKLLNGKFIFCLNKNSFELNFDEITGITLLGKKKMNIYVGNNTYQIFKGKRLNNLKYMQMYYILKNKKDGNNNEFLGL